MEALEQFVHQFAVIGLFPCLGNLLLLAPPLVIREEDLMGVVVFLASAASDYMCGAVVPVDGGWLAR